MLNCACIHTQAVQHDYYAYTPFVHVSHLSIDVSSTFDAKYKQNLY